MTHILALIDGSVYTHSVCDHAAWAARQYGGDIELLHVLSTQKSGALPTDLSGAIGLGARSSLLDDLVEHDARTAQLDKERGRAILDAAQQRLESQGIGNVSLALRTGEIADSLVKRAGDLIVMGKRGEGADFEKLHLGSNLERVVRAVHRPVLIASRTFKPIQHAVFAFDDGVSARKALDSLVQSPLADRPRITVFSVAEAGSDIARGGIAAAARLIKAGYEAVAKERPGHAEKIIAEETERDDADLLIMGAYGHSRIRSLIIGSTTTALIRSCAIPLLLFR
ncbi:MAG: universal stress protein UspA [Hyphomonas sp. BRH_c22]|jgi:nucleotide-binding universal stress UspA family protein|uniref:Universal stress protein UspA n=1 Tax=Hyphomonas chukchiensis TaxID=1280947 RepID=A0A062UCV6_9PROT|nr:MULTISPECIES: universal stress protein [Hyphomonas]KCZ56142.1 universal stress protein UspA [Hyphomonas chukchiensis]KJS39768.1 MAG: universal stress protein UspA [Hyphomonas sp. BRH_c22]|tara:strand:+ start:2187 stop:3035 length:849 start_codon:yes stop_codon:yes gene_type:complete